MSSNYVGLVLNQRYEITKVLGAGGMGVVLQAYDKFLDRDVAVKVIQPEYNWSQTAIDAFIREARIIARLEHPSILNIYDLGIHPLKNGSLVYLVMRLASGGTLADRLEKGPLPLNEVRRILEPVCEGLDYAHKQGVIHLDLKPLNILFDNHGNPMVADFGLAKMLQNATQIKADTRVGTFAYMPPEQLFGAKAGPFSDVYAVGITLYEMITGAVPNRGWDGTIHIDSSIPNEIKHIIVKATLTNPNQRYQKTGELIYALSSVSSPTTTITLARDAYNQGNLAYQQGNYLEAIHHYTTSLNLSPERALPYYARGLCYYVSSESDTHSYQSAIDDFSRAIDIDSTKPDYYFFRGKLYSQKSRREEAINDFSKVISLDPTYGAAYFERGKAKYYEDNFEEALIDLNRAIELKVNSPYLYLLRGEARDHLNDKNGALADYDEAIKLDPKYYYAYIIRSSRRQLTGDRLGAIEDLSKAYELDKSNLMLLLHRGQLFAEINEFQKAIADFSHVIQANPKDGQGYKYRADLYYRLGQLGAAFWDANSAVKLSPDDAECYEIRGRIRKDLGDEVGFESDLKEVERIWYDEWDRLDHQYLE